MHTTVNGKDTEIIEEQRNGDRWLIAKDIRIIQPQRLSNGYVPEQSVQQSVEQQNTHGGTGWDGIPALLGHSRNLSTHSWYDGRLPDGQPVLSTTSNVTEELGLGELENQRFEDGDVFVDLAVNTSRATEIGDGAVEVVEALDEGEPLDVSTQYVGVELPPGEYDGKQRREAEAIGSPDSLALLPNSSGECSTVDGCGVNPVHSPLGVAANDTDVHLATGHTPPADDDDPDRRGPAQAILQIATNAIDRIASLGGSDDPDPVAYPEEFDPDVVLGEALAGVEADEESTESDERAESRASQPTVNTDMDREKLMEKIMENSDIKQESLEGMGDSCLQTTHDSIVGPDGDDNGDDDGDSGADADGDGDGVDVTDAADGDSPDVDADGDVDGDADGQDTVVMDKDELESFIGEQVEQRVAANEAKRQREQRVDRIVANSAEYGTDDRDELMETPEGILDRIEKGLSSGTELPPAGAPTVNSGGSGDELGDIDVGTGVIDDIAMGAD